MNVFVETHGCELNKAESNSIKELIKEKGFVISDNYKECDVIIINTCAVRESAETKVEGQLGVYKSYREMTGCKIIVTGCMAEHNRDDLLKKFPYIDYLISNNDKIKIIDIIEDISKNTKTLFSHNEYYEFFYDYPDKEKIENYVPIQNGCNNFCSYCIVPYTRGREVSRCNDEIIAQLRKLDTNEVRIATLLGQNVNSYNYKGLRFEDLVIQIDKEDFKNIKWIYFESPHPKDFSDELIDILSQSRFFAPHFHIPIQSANDRILKLMNRKYDKKRIYELFDKLRTKIKNATFSSDIMVGFPTETDKEYQETLQFVKEIRFIDNFMYFYNPRPLTFAYKNYDDLPLDVKKARLDELIKTQRQISYEERLKKIGKKIDVTVKGPSKDGNILAQSFSRESVIIKEGEKNSLKNVIITEVKGSTLIAE